MTLHGPGIVDSGADAEIRWGREGVVYSQANSSMMNPFAHALRLLDTTQAFLGVGLAVAAIAAAVVAALVVACYGEYQRGARWWRALLIVCVGLLVGGATVEATYYSWFKHRCVDHGSDIGECFDKNGMRLHQRY